MRVLSYQVKSRIRRAARVAALSVGLSWIASGCLVGPGGEFESLSGGTEGTTSGGTTGFPPDEEACEAKPCDGDGGASECCDLNQPPTSLVPYACPGNTYPNNWACLDETTCVQPGPTYPGCNPALSGQEECKVQGFTCKEINGVGHCVALCSTTAECLDEFNMTEATCEIVDGVRFCMQVT
jgi:hypothetical protein